MDFLVDISIDSNDWITKTLDSLFDPAGVLVSGIFIYDSLLCAVGGLLLLWLSLRAIVATAQHGEPLGKHSEVWFPIRFTVAIGLMVPLPGANLSAAQLLMITSGKLGSSLANQVWNVVIDASAGLKPLVSPTPPNIDELVHQAWLIQNCITLHNKIAATSDLKPISLTVKEFDNRTVLTADGKIQGQCGYISFAKPQSSDGTGLNNQQQLSKIWQAHQRAMSDVLKSLEAPASTFASVVSTDEPMTDLPVSKIIQQYQSTYVSAAQSVVSDRSFPDKDNLRQIFANESKKGGWAFAGAWSLRLASLNGEVAQAINSLPGVATPRLDAYQGEVYTGFRASFRSADNFWMANAGKTSKQIDEKAYLAGVGNDSFLSFMDFSRVAGWYEKISLAESDANPIAEIISLGHWLIITAEAVLAAVAALQSFGGWIGGIIGSAIGPEGTVAGVAGGMMVSNILEKAGFIVYLLIFSIWVAGCMLAYVLPMTPFMYWIFFVARYLLRTGMAVLAGPLWAISHIELDGEGMGDRANHGWFALFDVFLRPVLAVLSLVVAFAVFIAVAKLFSLAFYPALRNTLSGHMGGFSGLVVFTVSVF